MTDKLTDDRFHELVNELQELQFECGEVQAAGGTELLEQLLTITEVPDVRGMDAEIMMKFARLAIIENILSRHQEAVSEEDE